MPFTRSLSVAILGLVALLIPALVVADPTYKAVCGDIASTTCPGEAFVGSTFTGVGCSNNIYGVTGYQYGGAALSVQACAAVCASKAISIYKTVEGVCYCYDDITGAASVDCAPEVYSVYYHGPGPQASGYSKRQQLARVRRAAEEDTTLCPAGRTACRIEGSDDGYECIDTMTELESCGGCLHGVLSAPPSSLPSSLSPRRPLRRGGMSPLVLGLGPSDAAPAAVGLDCSDRSQFGSGLTCRRGACVPI